MRKKPLGGYLCAWLCFFPVMTSYAASNHAMAGHGLPGVILETVGTVIVATVTVYVVKCFMRPGETDKQHIKHRVLRDYW